MSKVLDNAVIQASTTVYSQPIDMGDGNTLNYAVSLIVCGGSNFPTVSVELSSDLITWTPGASSITTTGTPSYDETTETSIAFRYARIVVVTGATSPSVVNVSVNSVRI